MIPFPQSHVNEYNTNTTAAGVRGFSTSNYLSIASASLTSVPNDDQIKTLSFWIKRHAIGTQQCVMSAGGASNYEQVYISSANKIVWDRNNSGAVGIQTVEYAMTDTTAWYHVCLSVSISGDVTACEINGVSQTITDTTAITTSETGKLMVNGEDQWIGSFRGASNALSASLAQFCFIDGSILTASSFGSTDYDTGGWKAKTDAQVNAVKHAAGGNSVLLNFSDESNLGDAY